MYYYIINNKNYKLPIATLLNPRQVSEIIGNLSIEPSEQELDNILTNSEVKYIKFPSKNQLKTTLYDKLKLLAISDSSVDFKQLARHINKEFITDLTYIQRSNNYTQVYMNRIIDMETNKVYSGCILHTNGIMIGTRAEVKHNINVDIIPFVQYRRIINHLEQINKKIYVNKLIFAFPFPVEDLITDYSDKHIHTEIVKLTPLADRRETERANLYNIYIKTGEKLTLPIMEI